MTNRKGQNSFLVLTTLGVYLGLLMVGGAAPQVLAHSATTRNFDIADEVEVKDDLDNKPDDCSEGASERAKNLLNLDFLSSGVIGLVNDLDAIAKFGKFSWTESFDYRILRKASEGGRVRSTITTTAGNSWTQLAVSDNADSISTICSWPGCSYYSYDDEFQSNAAVSNIDVAYNGSSFTVSVTLLQGSDTEAKELSGIFSEALKIGSCSDDYATSAQQVVYRYSVSKPGNGQVLIVTRLPRAGLDALLAKDAK